MGLFLNGDTIHETDERGHPLRGDSFLVLVNGWQDEVTFTLPSTRFGRHWALELATADPEAAQGSWTADARGPVPVAGRAITVLRRRR